MKALIYGTGSIGGVYGYILHKAGLDVVTLCRSNLKAVQEDGITIHSELWGEVNYRPTAIASVTEAAKSQGPFDFVFVCCKAVPGVCEQIRDAVTPGETAIVLAQNGIDIECEYAANYPSNTIISGVVWLAATQVRPGIITAGKSVQLEMGTYPASTSNEHKKRAEQLSELWEKGAGKGSAPVFDDVQSRRWLKLTVNATMNPIAALTRCDGGSLSLCAEQMAATDVLVRVMRQVGAVAASEGYTDLVTDGHIQKVMDFYHSQRVTGAKDSSMLMDVRAGRTLEVDAILGNLMKIARRNQVPVPDLELLYFLVTALNLSLSNSR